MRICALASGSTGNALLVEAPRGWLLIDAGLPWRQLRARAARAGFRLTRLSTVVITHEHADHVRGLSPLVRQGVEVWGSEGTLRALGLPGRVLGEEQELLGLRLRPFAVPHDALQPVGLRLELNGTRLGVATDLGQVTPTVLAGLAGCSTVVVEANHDLARLLSGTYPWPLKRRVMGPRGHLANEEAGQALARIAAGGLRNVVLAHLSRENNSPALALETVSRALDGWGGRLYLSYPDRPGAVVAAA
ncbi:MAG: MBL fold metallo-hydrolase [Candidatus Bipolaricaulaceae bacterium]